MSQPQSSEEIDRLARQGATAKLRWYLHASVYVAVNLFLFLASEHAFGHRRWSPFPLVGWGLGLTLHGVAVWLLGANDLHERMVQRERKRLLRRRDGA